MKQKPKTVTGHHKHKRKGRQPANPGQPKEKKKSTWAAINEKNYLCNLCGKTLKGLTAYKRHQVRIRLGEVGGTGSCIHSYFPDSPTRFYHFKQITY